MINNIKFDNINSILAPKKDQPANPQNPAAAASNDGITVSNDISKHINFLMSENYSTNEQSRVMEMKNRIGSNSYSINMDQLAKKIAQDVFGKNIG